MKNDLLIEAGKNFDSELSMVGVTFKGPGYHSLMEDGTWVHPTRNAIYYALHLLDTKDKNDELRAFKIIRKIISLQDVDSYSKTYGIWSWLYEEPLNMMAPPDWNWADFIGAALAHVIKDFGNRLPVELLMDVHESLGHAAWSIFRRNVGPEYTNIALMGVVVTAVAGEVLDEPRLVEYATRRIAKFEEYTLEQGGLNEYNSPTYTFVALHELERVVQLVDNVEIKEHAENVRHFVWKSLSEHYHPATKQLAGPHSRAYSDLLPDITRNYLDWATSDKSMEIYRYDNIAHFGEPIACPKEFRDRFETVPACEVVQKDVFVKRIDDSKSFYGTTWMNNEISLGSISRECFWTQRRPLIGYWNNDSGDVSVLRLRMLKDGKDFASGGMHNVQDKNKILTGIKFYIDRGDFHLHLDRKSDGCFNFKSLVLRYELAGKNATVKDLGGDRYELSSGNWKAVVSTLPSKFNGSDVVWQIGKDGDKVFLDAVLYEGEEINFCLDESVLTEIFITTELIKKDEVPIDEKVLLQYKDNIIEAKWQNMILTYNPYGEKY